MTHTLAPKPRLDFLDVAKGIGMGFVIFAHVCYKAELLVLIYSFHMPLFFILSGMLFRRDRYDHFGEFFLRRAQSLLLPYLIYSLTALVYVFISERMFPGLFSVSREKYLLYIRQIFLAQGSGHVLNTPLWFVPCLFAVEIGYYFLAKLDIRIRLPLVAALAFLGWLLESGLLALDNSKIFWTLVSGLYALGFYAFGNFVFPMLQTWTDRWKAAPRRIWICLAVMLGCLLLWAPLSIRNGKVSLGSRILNNGFLFFITGVLGTAAVLAGSLLLERCKFFRFLGQNSFTLMACHMMIRRYTLPKLYHVLGLELYNSRDLTESILPFFLVFVISILFTLCLCRIRKMLSRKKSGSSPQPL